MSNGQRKRCAWSPSRRGRGEYDRGAPTIAVTDGFQSCSEPTRTMDGAKLHKRQSIPYPRCSAVLRSLSSADLIDRPGHRFGNRITGARRKSENGLLAAAHLPGLSGPGRGRRTHSRLALTAIGDQSLTSLYAASRYICDESRFESRRVVRATSCATSTTR